MERNTKIPKIIRKYEKKLGGNCKGELAPKEKEAKITGKQKKKIALCQKITNTRKDYLHKMSTRLSAKTK